MPKVLICASSANHIKNFHLPYLRYFKEQEFEVHVAIPENEQFGNADFIHEIHMSKSMLSAKNFTAVRELCHVIRGKQV